MAEQPPPPSYSKDGKKLWPPRPSEPSLKIDVFANFAQFVYDDTNPENPLGARATTTANGGTQLVPNTDAFLLAWQIGAKFNFPHNFYFQLAPTLYNYTGNGDTFNIHYQGGDPHLTNSESLATEPDRHQQPVGVRYASGIRMESVGNTDAGIRRFCDQF